MRKGAFPHAPHKHAHCCRTESPWKENMKIRLNILQKQMAMYGGEKKKRLSTLDIWCKTMSDLCTELLEILLGWGLCFVKCQAGVKQAGKTPSVTAERQEVA